MNEDKTCICGSGESTIYKCEDCGEEFCNGCLGDSKKCLNCESDYIFKIVNEGKEFHHE